jgi:16S rRNA (uracil1498-N3)-methyltransferase
MSLDYFYSPRKNISGDIVMIDGDEFAHLTHVMRKREGDRIRVVDGEGIAYEVELTNLKKKTAEGKILEKYFQYNEPECSVTLAVGILKNPSRFDFLIEKVTELGVKEIIPLQTERTIPSHAKVERWQKLALSGMKQSCRSYLPVVHELTSPELLLTFSEKYERRIVFHEKSKERFITTVQEERKKSILLAVGPEGGFSDNEIGLLTQNAFEVFNLGERRLRTETAAIIATSLFALD